MTLSYRYTPYGQPAEAIHQTIRLESTPCTLGGHRTWFTCPACNRRVAVIYGARRLFGCRRCKGLAYSSQAEGADDRASRGANRLRKKLGWEPGILNGPGSKPKGMHWRTCERLLARHEGLIGIALAGMAEKMGLLQGRLEGIGADLHSRR